MSNSVRPHRRQPTRPRRPWDSPGKNTGVGCHFLLQCMKVKSESEVVQSCPTLIDPMDCSLPGASVHGILQMRVLEWGAIAFRVPFSDIPYWWEKLGVFFGGTTMFWPLANLEQAAIRRFSSTMHLCCPDSRRQVSASLIYTSVTYG